MTADGFWQIIADVNAQCAGDMEAKVKGLTERLQAMDAKEVLAFSGVFDSMMDTAYSWDLWGAAYVIQGGCSDDGFMDFRSSLISMGKGVFDAAVLSPDTLADLPHEIVEALYFEGFAYPMNSVYEEKEGDLPERATPHPTDPSGEPWEEDEEVLEARFPKLWGKYGEAPAEPDPPPQSRPWWKFW